MEEAGKLRASHVGHAVAALSGAVCLQRCTFRALLGAEERKASSIAFPALGTGVGEVPQALAAQLMIEAVRTFAKLKPNRVHRVDIVLYSQKSYETWLDIICSIREHRFRGFQFLFQHWEIMEAVLYTHSPNLIPGFRPLAGLNKVLSAQ